MWSSGSEGCCVLLDHVPASTMTSPSLTEELTSHLRTGNRHYIFDRGRGISRHAGTTPWSGAPASLGLLIVARLTLHTILASCALILGNQGANLAGISSHVKPLVY